MRILLFLLLFSNLILSQDIPDINWTRAGNNEKFASEVPRIDFLEVKASFTRDVTDDVVIQTILEENAEGVKIIFQIGEYHFNQQIKLSSNTVLRGVGEESILIFDLDKEVDCIVAQGKMKPTVLKLDTGVSKGENILRCSEQTNIQTGDYLYLIDQDKYLITSSWSMGRTGQIVQVRNINKNSIELNSSARRAFPLEKIPAVLELEMVKGVGIENLHIINNNKTNGQTSTIKFRLAENCWVGGVKSEKANYSHVLLEYAVNCEIIGCEISDAHDFGNGGKAYGITLQFGTSDCLIMSNKLSRLRHSILLQAGANGNVIYKNVSKKPYWTNVRLPEDSAGDIVLHGNYVYANLFEENSCQTIVVDNSHGKNGEDNLFFSNHVNGYGIVVHRKSTGQAFVNNEIASNKWPKGRYKIKGKHFEQYNLVKGKRKPKKSKKLERKSFWL
jgi:hypothetical protein